MATAYERTEEILRRPQDRRPLGVPPPEVATKLESLGPEGAAAAAEMPFSVFIPAHEERAITAVEELMAIANERGNDAVLDRVEELAQEVSVEFAQYCLMVYITHHPRGQELPIAPLEERAPELVVPSSEPKAPAELEALGATGAEAALDWYREDPAANFHHERWHIVYPFRGVPNPANPIGPRRLKDRQGELFLYMHEQMLARYDHERIGVNLGIVQPISNYRSPLPEGYIPNLSGFSSRSPNSLMTNSQATTTVTQLENWTRDLFGDTNRANATLSNGGGTTVPATPDLIGNTSEANIGAVRDPKYGGQSGGLHNNGHVVIGQIPGPGGAAGVMLSTSVAIRDPIFYRWHRRIDDAMFNWQEKQAAQNFADAPRATLRDGLSGTAASGKSPDVLVVSADKVTGDAQAFGDRAFGGDNWTKDPAQSGVVTDLLKTRMVRRGTGASAIQMLDHEDYFYFIRAEAAAEQTVTVRIFLIATSFIGQAGERRRWIELDRFQQKLKAGRNVIVRSSRLAAVARKPAIHVGETPPPPEPGADPNYCDCGWPYHLLLPRGTSQGKIYRLMVMLTDWNIDKVEVEGKCGSMSFCGKRDAKYPDARPMGYPFDRKWPKRIADTILEQKNMAARDIRIQLT